MTKYLYRTCPKCGDYLGVVVCDPPGPKSEILIDAYCVVCGFKLNWKVILGKKSPLWSASTVLLLLTVFAASFLTLFSLFAKASHKLGPKWYLVTRVVDRDTLILDGRERVRLIGVDTPETGNMTESPLTIHVALHIARASGFFRKGRIRFILVEAQPKVGRLSET